MRCFFLTILFAFIAFVIVFTFNHIHPWLAVLFALIALGVTIHFVTKQPKNK